MCFYRRPHLQSTINLLLNRGADPNASSLPMSVLFYAVKSADPEAVHSLLQQKADTSSRLKTMVCEANTYFINILPDS